jgi:hypothetical protein
MLTCVISSSSLSTGRPQSASAIRRQARQQVLFRCCGIKGGLDGFTILLVQFSHQGNYLVACCDFDNAPCASVDRDGTHVAYDAVVPVARACVHEWQHPDVGVAASLKPWLKPRRDRGRVVLSDVPIGDFSQDPRYEANRALGVRLPHRPILSCCHETKTDGCFLDG